MHVVTRFKLAQRRAMKRYRMKKLVVCLEIDVLLMSDTELEEIGYDGLEPLTINDYGAEEVANVLSCDGHEMWTEHFAGSGLFVKFDKTRVASSYWVE
jgi:hypothetical protein